MNMIEQWIEDVLRINSRNDAGSYGRMAFRTSEIKDDQLNLLLQEMERLGLRGVKSSPKFDAYISPECKIENYLFYIEWIVTHNLITEDGLHE